MARAKKRYAVCQGVDWFDDEAAMLAAYECRGENVVTVIRGEEVKVGLSIVKPPRQRKAKDAGAAKKGAGK